MIVDDIIRSGSTVKALIRFCESVKADIAGVYAILSVGEGVDRIAREHGIRIETIVRIT